MQVKLSLCIHKSYAVLLYLAEQYTVMQTGIAMGEDGEWLGMSMYVLPACIVCKKRFLSNCFDF